MQENVLMALKIQTTSLKIDPSVCAKVSGVTVWEYCNQNNIYSNTCTRVY